MRQLSRRNRKRPPLRLETLERRFLLASISGVYFADENRNGIQDDGESPLSNTSVALLDNASLFLQETSTDVDGRYSFDNLATGNYFVRVNRPAGSRVAAPRTPRRSVEPVSGVSAPLALGSGLFDGDAQPEVFALEGGGTPRVTILRDVNDNLQHVTSFAVASDPQTLTVADLNADGFSDFVVTLGEGVVAVAINDQQNGFRQAVTYDVGGLPRGLVAVDLDQDGDRDLAVLSNFDSTLTLLANDGAGSFSNSGVIDVGPGPESVVARDIDGDNRPDLVIANLGDGQQSGGFSLLHNTTSVAQQIDFSAAQTVDLRSPVFDVAAERFFDTNLDGVVTATDTPQILVGRLMNRAPTGNGIAPKLTVFDADTLDVLREFDLSERGDTPALRDGTAGAIDIGDFDSDGDLDVAIAATNKAEIIFFANQNQRHFTERIIGGFLGQFSTTTKAVLTSLDADLDGDLDFVVANQVASGNQETTLLRTMLLGSDVRLTLDTPNEMVDDVNIAIEPIPFTVNSLGDGSDTNLSDGIAMASDGAVTMRAAIEQANATSGLNIIEFDIPGIGPHFLSPASVFPAISGPLVIDGNDAAEFQQVQIDGGGSLPHALTVNPDSGAFIDAIAFSGFIDAGIRIIESDPIRSAVLLQDGGVEVRVSGVPVFRSASGRPGTLRLIEPAGGFLQLNASQTGIQGVITAEFDAATQTTLRRLRLEGRDQTLDLRVIDNEALRGIDVIDLTDATRHQLSLNRTEISNLTSGTVLRLASNSDDRIDVFGEGYLFSRVELGNGRLVHSFVQGNITIVFDGPTNWTNPVDSFDVNRNQSVTASDALVVINELARRKFSDAGGDFIDLEQVDLKAFFFYDVSRDNRVTALDALRVINELGRRGLAGRVQSQPEQIFDFDTSEPVVDSVWQQYDLVEDLTRRPKSTGTRSFAPSFQFVAREPRTVDPLMVDFPDVQSLGVERIDAAFGDGWEQHFVESRCAAPHR